MGDIYVPVDINGKKFSELPEDMREAILSFEIKIEYMDNLERPQIEDMFARLNNGKSLSSIEKMRVTTKSIDEVKKIAKHDFFTSILSENAIEKYTNEDIVNKTYIVLFEKKPCLDAAKVAPIMKEADFTTEIVDTLNKVFDRMATINGVLDKSLEKYDKEQAKKIKKRIFTKTHLISIMPTVNKSIKDGMKVEDVTDFLCEFFNGKEEASISKLYNRNANNGSGHAIQTENRLDCIADAYKKFARKKKAEEKKREEEEAKLKAEIEAQDDSDDSILLLDEDDDLLDSVTVDGSDEIDSAESINAAYAKIFNANTEDSSEE